MSSSPLSTEARRFVRLARQEIAAVKDRGLTILAPGASDLSEAGDALMARLGKLGLTRRADELRRICAALARAGVSINSHGGRSRRTFGFDVLLPFMVGHPISPEEASSMTIEGIRCSTGRGGDHGIDTRLMFGALTEHALGRFAERTCSDRTSVNNFLVAVSWGSYYIAGYLPHRERSIFMRIDERAVLAGVTRVAQQAIKDERGRERIGVMQLADWRTVLQDDWLTPDELRFANGLLEIVAKPSNDIAERLAELPHLPYREDYIDRTYGRTA